MSRLDGKVAIVTGATSGIGRVLALVFARQGAKVVAVGRRAELGDSLVKEIKEKGGEGLFVRADVTEPGDIERTVRTAVDRYGKLDTVVNNAGGAVLQDGKYGDILRLGDQAFWDTMKLNVYGTWIACKLALPEIIKAGGGSIVNMVSLAGVKATPDRDAYTAAKGAVVALTRSLALEFAPDKVRVNAIAPGITKTERLLGMLEQLPDKDVVVGKQKLGMIDPHEIAYPAVYFASDESKTTTGQTLIVEACFAG